MTDPGTASEPRPDEFVRLFVAHQRRILAFICSLVPQLSDAEDLTQEVGTVLWEKFGEFRPGTDFCAWAFRIAQLKVLEHRRRQRRQRVLFTDELLGQIATEAVDMSSEMELQQRALDMCLAEMTERNRELVQARYGPGGTLVAAARQVGRSVVTARSMLRRIHGALLDCVVRKMKEAGL